MADDDQGALFAEPEKPADPAGPVELATRRSVEAAQLDPRDEGLAAALVAHARAFDQFGRAGKLYGTTHGLPPFLDAARALGLAPDSDARGGTAQPPDEFAAIVARWAEPSTS